MPTPPRTTVSPLPLRSQAKPTRGSDVEPASVNAGERRVRVDGGPGDARVRARAVAVVRPVEGRHAEARVVRPGAEVREAQAVVEGQAGLDLPGVLDVGLAQGVVHVVDGVLRRLAVVHRAAPQDVGERVARASAFPRWYSCDVAVRVGVAGLGVRDVLVVRADLERVQAPHLGEVVLGRDLPLLREQDRVEAAGVEDEWAVARPSRPGRRTGSGRCCRRRRPGTDSRGPGARPPPCRRSRSGS